MSETLTQFGTSFQSKIIASLLRDVKFIQTINDILNPDMLDSDSNKWLVNSIRDYYTQYKKRPTLEVIKYKVDEIENDVLKSGVVDKLREVWKNIEATDLEFVQSQTLDFCKNQSLKNIQGNIFKLKSKLRIQKGKPTQISQVIISYACQEFIYVCLFTQWL